jgi:hypothetical protein
MKIKMTRDTICGGKAVKTGEVIEAQDKDAKTLILMGKAKATTDKGGKASKPKGDSDTPDIDKMLYADLVAHAKEIGIEGAEGTKKADLIKLIKDKQPA